MNTHDKPRVAWVTGITSGLGKAAMEGLLNEGWLVAGGARSVKEGREGNLLRVKLDVTDENSVRLFAREAEAAFGAPDAVVNAAGLLVLGPAETTDVREYERVMDVCFFGAVRVTQAALPLMRKKGGGAVVIFSSVNGLLGTPFQSAYTAAKHALEGFAECLHMEASPHGIRVTLVEPGDHRGGSSRCRLKAEGVKDTYRASFDRVTARIAHDESTGSDPDKFGRRLARAMRRPMGMRLRVAMPSQHGAVLLHSLAFGHFFQRLLARYYRV